MGKRLDSVLTLTLVLSALGVSGSYVYRTFYLRVQPADSASIAATKMRSWNKALAVGHQVAGDSTSLATMVVFADFQCPACRGFHRAVVKTLLEKYPQELRVVYLQFPLSYHAQAMPAARATECVADLGDIRRWIDLLYEKQDSLGSKSYAEFARDIGVRDTARVAACARGMDPVARIGAAADLGTEISIRGTPTVVLDGWVLPRPPSLSKIDTVIAAARAARQSSRR